MLCAVLWTWLHLLQFCVSNQSLNPGEDVLNKPWRPIPSGIVSVLNARILRWILLPLCLSLSMSLEALWQGVFLAIGFLVYNELHLDSHWLMRNALNAWGYASFNAGASSIAGASGYYSFHTVFSNDRMPCARPIDYDLTYFNLICPQCPHSSFDNPCPGFPR